MNFGFYRFCDYNAQCRYRRTVRNANPKFDSLSISSWKKMRKGKIGLIPLVLVGVKVVLCHVILTYLFIAGERPLRQTPLTKIGVYRYFLSIYDKTIVNIKNTSMDNYCRLSSAQQLSIYRIATLKYRTKI